MNILLHDNQLNERGTTGALLEYARSLTKSGHRVSISYQIGPYNNLDVVRKTSLYYELLPYEDFSDIKRIPKGAFDVAYLIKSGKKDGKIFANIPSGVHAVFNYFQPHGSAYAYVSDWLAEKARKKAILQSVGFGKFKDIPLAFKKQISVPHIVNLPDPNENVRGRLGIPSDALCGVRIGGLDTFDVKFVHEEMLRLLNSKKNLYFLLVNTEPFSTHPRLIHIPTIYEKQEKVNILASSDFFLHARSNGESFGLSVLEAMKVGVPVLSWRGGRDQNHTRMLTGESLYSNAPDLKRKIESLPEYTSVERNKAVANQFSPEIVMPIFEDTFLSIAE